MWHKLFILLKLIVYDTSWVIHIKVDIIGGSLSGLAAAISLCQKRKDIEVIVHEKHKVIGHNHDGRRCGEAHSFEPHWKKWIPTGKSYFNEIRKIDVVSGSKSLTFDRPVGTAYVLNRPEFICQLKKEAETHGAKIQVKDKIRSIKDLDGDYIIDASGCPSVVKRELGFNHGLKGITFQQTIENSNCFKADTLKIVFIGAFGYYWVFPRDPTKNEVNVGLGYCYNLGFDLKEELEKFKKAEGIKGDVNYTLGGLIPGGFQYPLRHKNILFVGDSGVGTLPMSGQGIYRALISGDVAGRCIAYGYPKRYPSIMSKYFFNFDVVGKFLLYANWPFKYVNPHKSFSFTNWSKILGKMAHA